MLFPYFNSFCACTLSDNRYITGSILYKHRRKWNECKLIKNKLKTTKKSQYHALKSLQETFNWFMYHGVY